MGLKGGYATGNESADKTSERARVNLRYRITFALCLETTLYLSLDHKVNLTFPLTVRFLLVAVLYSNTIVRFVYTEKSKYSPNAVWTLCNTFHSRGI